MDLNLTGFPGWHLIGQFPEGDPDGVGSWLLFHKEEALLLEIPPRLSRGRVQQALTETGTRLKYVAASHDHEDHLDPEAWEIIARKFPAALPIRPSKLRKFKDREHRLLLGGEPIWLLQSPKHSLTDTVTVFRGVAMTGDIELGTLDSVNDEVPLQEKMQSMEWLAGFCERHSYQVHSTVSAHLNDVRTNVCWEQLFSAEPAPAR